ncbi:hypothetical protein SAMN05216382_2676 [Sphingomonas palmae]|uniref:Uncharacterized protein n=2 Tax=Sphingomonas palmae TaxID=1855283 RepID=A0A1H7T8L0_9SPHN|nr:hypothetical protein SAMN05216382_2676 [Sphingomonas palmae]
MALIWAVNALQTGRSDKALPFFRGVPAGAATEGIVGPHAVYPWELETLANELLTTPRRSRYTTFDAKGWPSVTALVNLLRRLEGAEYAARRAQLPIMQELGRISARQFEWQRGFTTTAEFYRSVSVYGQGDSARYLAEEHKLTVADMTFVGYGLMAGFLLDPVMRPGSDLKVFQALGVAPERLQAVLARIARPISHVVEIAPGARAEGDATAYKPSVLRQFPCITFGPRGRRMRAPLPDLIVSRVTSGLFYDVVGGGGAVRADYGRRFEAYVLRLLGAMLPQMPFEREFSYRAAGEDIASPDILLTEADDSLRLIIECKATRMSFNARFSEDPSGERGYEEMAKGVAQIWRFFSHCRRGLTGRALSNDVRGLLLSLDDWFVARPGMIEKVMVRAEVIAGDMDPGIVVGDRRPVTFASIAQLESVLRVATPETLLQAVEEAAKVDRYGWLLSSIHTDLFGTGLQRRPFPFDDELEELLPWWRLVRQARDAQL